MWWLLLALGIAWNLALTFGLGWLDERLRRLERPLVRRRRR